MPISNPSYFPAVRGVDQIVGLNAGLKQTGARVFLAGQNAGNGSSAADLIVIGDNALIENNANNPGSIVFGVSAAKNLQYWRSNTGTLSNIVIGDNAYSFADAADSTILIGANIFNGQHRLAGNNNQGIGLTRMVAIGHDIFSLNPQSAQAGSSDSVLIGYGILQTLAGNQASLSSCVLIGSRIGATSLVNSSYANSTIIGSQAGSAVNTGNTAVGSAALSAMNSTLATNNTAIGFQSGQNIITATQSTLLGYNSGNGLGDNSKLLALSAGGINVLIGNASPLATGGCNFAFGNVTYSQVSLASALNTIFLSNGAPASVNPTGGGYFYISAGALHYVGSSGTDTLIAPA